MANSINFSKSICCLITGASRGIGRTISIEIARRSNKLTLILLARSEIGLNETKDLIEKVNKNAKVIIVALDFSSATADQYENMMKSSLNDIKKEDIESALIFHNAGQIGSMKKVVDIPDILQWQNYYTLNVFSVTALNSIFIKNITEFTDSITVVNITSLCGRKAFKYLGMYGSGKAARDLYFKVLAEEESNILVLNWSPGMVHTDMVDELLTNMDDIQGTSEKDKTIASTLTSEQTINKMFMVLEKGEFTSGDIIDYYD